MNGLFDEPLPPPESALGGAPRSAPLAESMRPRTLLEFVGQRELVGEGRIVERLLAGELRQSLILWGPPGSGKTTLARLIAATGSLPFVPFSAVLSGIKEIKEVMAQAALQHKRSGRPTLLFVDEIHRFNKAQQDAFLPHVERGEILLIGATTENPSFEIVSPLLSRARTLVLKPHGEGELVEILRRALFDAERGLAGRIQVEPGDLELLARAADGDARRALTLLETAATLLGGAGRLTRELLAETLQAKVLRYDKSGEEHYNLISALHKSIRNGDANAALYWLTRMLVAGEERRYLARRLVRIAVEDIGLADPAALRGALDAAEASERLGEPEGDLALVQAAVTLARAPKSNALYRAYGEAQADVAQRSAEPVPLHLCNAPTELLRAAGYGKGYRYVHDDPKAAEEMSCMPPGLEGRDYFRPSEARRTQTKP
jgi:putative ATPase